MEGTLERTRVTEVLQRLRTSRQSGVLHVASNGATKRVYLKEGQIVFASSDDGRDRLGEILVQSGRLERSQVELACRVRESSPLRLGKTLVEMGYMSEEELDGHIKRQVETILFSVVPWSSGFYRAELIEPPLDDDLLRQDISTESILLEGARALEDEDTIRDGIGDLDASLRFGADPGSVSTGVQLTPQEGFVLSRVDGSSTAREIAKISPMGELETLRCIYALIVAGILEVLVRKPAPAIERPPKVVQPPPPPRPEPEKPAEPELSPEALEFRNRMLRKHAQLEKLNHYELLDLATNATPEEIKGAFFDVAKTLHPDHRAGLKIEDPNGIYDELYLGIKAAYEVLSRPTERRRYDFTLERSAGRTKSKPEPERKDAKRAAENKGDGKSAPGPPKAPPRTFDAKQMARLHYTNGERFYRQSRFHEAVEELQDAVRLDSSRPEYHRLLARCLAKNPKWRRRAEEHFLKVLATNRFDIQTMIDLGDLYEAGGMETRAKKMFEQALGMDPGNPMALQRLADRQKVTTMDKLRGILERTKGH